MISVWVCHITSTLSQSWLRAFTYENSTGNASFKIRPAESSIKLPSPSESAYINDTTERTWLPPLSGPTPSTVRVHAPPPIIASTVFTFVPSQVSEPPDWATVTQVISGEPGPAIGSPPFISIYDPSCGKSICIWNSPGAWSTFDGFAVTVITEVPSTPISVSSNSAVIDWACNIDKPKTNKNKVLNILFFILNIFFVFLKKLDNSWVIQH